MSDRSGPAEPALERVLTLPMLVLYGLGVTVGAGIYVLIGASAARAGSHTPIAFILAAVVMALSAASFTELAGRYPLSAGEAAYVRAGFRSERAALIVGLLVAGAGVIAAAAISRGAAGYIGVLVSAPPGMITLAVVLVMGAIAAWGISHAVGVAAAMTAIEIGGLLVVIVAGFWRDPAPLAHVSEIWTGLGTAEAWRGIVGAGILAFFAFIGFEGMVNVVEEVKDPERTLPRAILITLVVTTVLYILVVWVALRAVPHAELAKATAPLSLVFERLTGASPRIIALIAIVATINGIIAQIVMASRVIYGMASQGVLPERLASINAHTRTPLEATLAVTALTLALALVAPIERLADITTAVMLTIFAAINAALIAIKLRGEPSPSFIDLPIVIPVLGCLSCIGLLGADLLMRH